MKPRIAVFGNQHLNLGHAIAADLALSGYEVNVFDLPEFEETITPLKKEGGIHVTGHKSNLVSKKNGFAEFNAITTDPEKALKEADVLFVDVPADEFEKRLKPIAAYIKEGAILHFNYYGYWPSLRLISVFEETGKSNIAITECPSTLYYARGKGTHLDFQVMKKRVSLSVFPGKRSREVFDVMHGLYPNFELAANILQTNFENQNMLWHPAIALLNVGHFDRADRRGDTSVYFYNTGITKHTGILSEAQDREREAVCNAYGIPYTPMRDLIKQYVNGHGNSMEEVQRNANFLKARPAYPVHEWEKWTKWDMPMALVPFVQLAELAGLSVPIHKGLVNIFGAVLGMDFWKTGFTLERLNLGGLSKEEVLDYVEEGKR